MSRMFRVAGSMLIVLLVFGLLSGTAAARESLTVKVDKHATIVDGGQAVDVAVTVQCASGLAVLEAFAYVVQNGVQSQFAGIPVTCDGKRHKFSVRVSAFPETLFQPGEAQVSGFVLLLDESSQTTVSASPSQTILLR